MIDIEIRVAPRDGIFREELLIDGESCGLIGEDLPGHQVAQAISLALRRHGIDAFHTLRYTGEVVPARN